MSEDASQPANLYADHVATLLGNYEDALDRAGAEWALVPSGEIRYQFLDDRPYEFAANPHFKAWVPLTEHPGCAILARRGERPTLFYLQARDYWHLPPAEPAGYWVGEFDIEVIADPAEIARHLPADRSKAIVIGRRRRRRILRYRPHQPACRIEQLAQRPYLQDRLRTRGNARGAENRRCRSSGRTRCVPRRPVRVRYPRGILRGDAPARNRAALRQHRRVE